MKKTKKNAGMTLTELLASLLILSMLTLVISGGVVAVKNAYEKVVRKADAQQILATTAELMTEELASALDVESAAGETESRRFLSGKENAWIWFSGDKERGICIVYDGGDADSGIPLLSSGAMAGRFYTAFESCTYENACFTVKNIAVYEKNGTGTGTPAAVLPELTVRAVNLEGL